MKKVVFILIPFLLVSCKNSDISLQETSSIIYSQNFNHHEVMTYSMDMRFSDWGEQKWDNGVEEGRVSIVEDGEQEKVLAVLYPSGQVKSPESGAQWKQVISKKEKMTISYKVKPREGFEFVKGGKLPGLGGGSANTGSNIPTGEDSWTARVMWNSSEGDLVQYLYHPDQAGKFGDKLAWEINGQPARLTVGEWNTLKTTITMNTAGESDGQIQSWLNGELALDKRDIRFRTIEDLAIDIHYFSTFFGGDDDSYQPSKDEVMYFDDFLIESP